MQKTAGYRTLRWFHCSGKQKVSFAWRIRQQTAKSAAEFFAYILTGKRSANQRKKIQGCDFLLNRRPNAKIQLIWTKKKNRPKFDIEWLCSDVLLFSGKFGILI